MGQRGGQSNHLNISLGFKGLCNGQVTEGRREAMAHWQANQPAVRIGVKNDVRGSGVPAANGLQKLKEGLSWEVQWLTLCPSAGGSGSVPGQKLDPVCCN